MRLFVAVWPPPRVVDQLRQLRRPAVGGLRWTRADQWHVTLHFLGQVEEPARVLEAFARIEAPGAVEAQAGPATAVLGQVLCLPVTGLEEVAAAVIRDLGDVGPGADRDFAGHVTLARPRGGGSGRTRRDLRALAGAPFQASWQVEAVTLVASETRPEGARYEVVAEVPLAR